MYDSDIHTFQNQALLPDVFVIVDSTSCLAGVHVSFAFVVWLTSQGTWHGNLGVLRMEKSSLSALCLTHTTGIFHAALYNFTPKCLFSSDFTDNMLVWNLMNHQFTQHSPCLRAMTACSHLLRLALSVTLTILFLIIFSITVSSQAGYRIHT